MELKDTITLMTSNDYRDRLKAEYLQLKIRMDRLNYFLNRDPSPLVRLDLMATQYKVMNSYQKLLEVRLLDEEIDIEEINLEE